ncbi:hypothetical protein CJ030_MR7G010575 [Morella rubra]|uniref:Rubredoxin-like domain-containing protein n=1 Tax=Morella rubra TaxID=262757 RepID=A0A6A1UYH0_9ROSI|nr:hypothetical protein CJ030_MR7G010575 [Morella rubra]
MSSAAVAGSSACTAAFPTNHAITTSSITPVKPFISSKCQKTTFQGLSLQEAKRFISDSFLVESRSSFANVRRGLQVTARTAGASKTIEAEIDKPLGLTLGQKPGGGVVVTAVDGGGNAAKAGIKTGDQVLYTSSFFGDELWPADKLGFTKTAIQAKPDSVYFVVSSKIHAQCPFIHLQYRGAEVDVKRLQKRPAPPRFGRKLTDTQKASNFLEFGTISFSLIINHGTFVQARATHICLDCGFIYFLQKPFDEQPDTYVCPQCRAPKKRFARYDVNSGKAVGGGLPPIGVIIGLVAGIGGVAALLVYGLQ